MFFSDLVLIFDFLVEVVLERIVKDKNRSGTEKFEELNFLQTVREIFLELPALFPDEKIELIDASQI